MAGKIVIGIVMLVGISMIVLSLMPIASFADVNNPTFVLLVNGFNDPGNGQWMMGVNIYQQLVNAGFTVGIVSFYLGPFVINLSNGLQITNNSFYGTNNTPIENISYQLYLGINNLTSIYGNINLDIVGYSMGGLVVAYMLENYLISANLENVIFIGTPFGGTPYAKVVSYLQEFGLLDNYGYQIKEMSPGSKFIMNLQSNEQNIINNYPNTVIITYAGDCTPWWAKILFHGMQNDGVVTVQSATDIYHNYQYVFHALHTVTIVNYTYHGYCYFQDQNVANTLINNLNGNY
ncbi:MAG: lipase family alpha/beta hydrolase [Thermoplasmata archaeon]